MEKNFSLPRSAFDAIPENELYIFPSQVTKSLAEDLKSVEGPAGPVPHPFSYSLYAQAPNIKTKGGEARVVDSSNFTVSTNIAAALVTLHPGALREMHWHPNADEWLYFISGQGRVTVFAAVGHARTMDFVAGDVGYIPKSMGHYIENTGDTDLRFLETFRSSYYASISLSNWMGLTPPELIQAHTNMSLESIATFPKTQKVIV